MNLNFPHKKIISSLFLFFLLSVYPLYSSEFEIIQVHKDSSVKLSRGDFEGISKGALCTIVKKIENRWIGVGELRVVSVFDEYSVAEPVGNFYTPFKGDKVRFSKVRERKKLSFRKIFEIGMGAMDFQKIDKAYHYFYRGIILFPDNPHLLLGLSRYYVSIGEYESSAEVLRQLGVTYRDWNTDLSLQSLFYNLMGITASGLNWINGAIRHFDHNIENNHSLFNNDRLMLGMAYLLKASIMDSLGYTSMAESLFKKGCYTTLHLIETRKFLNAHSVLYKQLEKLQRRIVNGNHH